MEMTMNKVLSRRFYKAGYEVRTQEHEVGNDKDTIVIKSAYTPNGDYIGDPRMARNLILKRNIVPQLAKSKSTVCTIGYCPKDGEWYGWSHRAIRGFKVGTSHKVDQGPKLRITTWQDAKQMAINFAESVS